MLTLEQILAADDTKPVIVNVPEWGGEVNVYPLTSAQIEELERWQDDNPALVGFRAKLIGMALRDLKLTPDDVRKLQEKSGAVIKRLSNIAADLCKPDYGELEGN